MALVASAYSTSVSGTNNSTEWLLRDVLAPTTFVVPPISDIQFTSTTDEAVFNPLGRPNYVVIQDVARGETISMTLRFITQTDYVTFETLRKSLRTLLLQSDSLGEQWYVRLGSERRSTLLNTAARKTAPFREVTIEAIQVDAP